MTLNDEQKRAILEYGESKYWKGYSSGFTSGAYFGSLLMLTSLLIVTLIKEKKH